MRSDPTDIQADLNSEWISILHGCRAAITSVTSIGWMLGIASLAIGLREAIAAVSNGSNDVLIWWAHAANIRTHGLAWTYANSVSYNHPPLMGLWVAACQHLFPENLHAFSILLKTPGILGEGLSCALLFDIWSKRSGIRGGIRAATAYALAPVMMLVSGFHGNTDALFAALSLLSVWALVERKSALGSGVALGAALNVKLIPVMLIIPLLICIWNRREVARFLVGMSLCAIPFLPFALAEPLVIYRNMLAYNGNVEHWGVTYLLLSAQTTPALAAATGGVLRVWLVVARYLVLAGAVVFSIVLGRRREPGGAYVVGAFCYAFFLVVTPGFGIQYLAALPPLLFACDARAGWWWSAIAGLFAFVLYYSFHLSLFPYSSEFTSRYPLCAASLGLLAWASTALVLWNLAAHPRRYLAKLRGTPTAGRCTSSDDGGGSTALIVHRR